MAQTSRVLDQIKPKIIESNEILKTKMIKNKPVMMNQEMERL